MEPLTASQTTLELMALLENGDIDMALLSLDAKNGPDMEEILEPWGPLQVTVVQLAAWCGSLEILKRLDARGADLNSTDKLGRCALLHAAHQGHVEAVRWLLERGVAVENQFGIRFFPKDRPYTFDGTAGASYEVGKKLPLPECWGRTALHQAVEAKHVEVVKLLVDAGANVDVCDERGETPLHLASSNVDEDDSEKMLRYEKIVDILVSGSASVNFPCRNTGLTALHNAVRLGNREATERLLNGGACPVARLLITGITPLHIAVSTGSHQILKILLMYATPLMTDVQDEAGKTPLHEAIYQGDLRCVRALIDCGGNLAAKEKCGETAISAIFGHVANPVAFLTDILDARVHATDNTTSKVILDFRVLAPQGKQQMAVIAALIRAMKGEEQMKVLQHPLVEAFLGMKWSHLRGFFFILVAIYVFFLISLSGHAILPLYKKDRTSQVWTDHLPRWILILTSCLLISHYMIQLVLMPRHYMAEFETWCSMITVIISLVVGITEQVDNESNPEWVALSVSIAILFAWTEMMLLVARFPTCGYYALMFSTVLKNVLKVKSYAPETLVLLAFGWLIVGFALSFCILFHDKKQFYDPWKAVVKTVVMMTGEYEYGELFSLHVNKIASNTSNCTSNSILNCTADGSGSNESRTLYSSFFSGIVFLTFVMLASIVLMNLMIGLAVSDIQGLLNMGHIRRMMKQAAFVTHLDRLHSHWIFQSRLVPKCIREMLLSMHHIPTRLTLEKSAEYDKGAHRISERLVEVFFDLASANWDLDKAYDTDSPCGESNECNLAETILYLQERIKELQQKKIRRQKRNSFKRKGGCLKNNVHLSN